MMRRIVSCLAVLALLGGCAFSRGVAYYKVSGSGRLADTQIPKSMEYEFGSGSVLIVDTDRNRADVEITLTARLKDAVRFSVQGTGIRVVCEGKSVVLPVPGVWSDKRIKDGLRYTGQRYWGDTLDAVDPRFLEQAMRGDFTTGEYQTSMTVRECKDLPFTLDLPTAQVGSAVHEFGTLSLTPLMTPVAYTLPVPARVEAGSK
ncbi:MAG: hypothetical protein ABW171_09745 [Steroidobacter sp.]